MKQATAPERLTARCSFVLTPAEYQRLTERAERNGRTIAGEVRYLVRPHLEQEARDDG